MYLARICKTPLLLTQLPHFPFLLMIVLNWVLSFIIVDCTSVATNSSSFIVDTDKEKYNIYPASNAC